MLAREATEVSYVLYAPVRDYDTPTFRSTGGRSSSELYKHGVIEEIRTPTEQDHNLLPLPLGYKHHMLLRLGGRIRTCGLKLPKQTL